ncbi:hypothetical protein GGR52DRAFT_576697 [Hypoxylon sp. FL1284]|nr:hypothetical protein GGR52DRAFT_576697 [Hypoxylon sp. FL1284]
MALEDTPKGGGVEQSQDAKEADKDEFDNPRDGKNTLDKAMEDYWKLCAGTSSLTEQMERLKRRAEECEEENSSNPIAAACVLGDLADDLNEMKRTADRLRDISLNTEPLDDEAASSGADNTADTVFPLRVSLPPRKLVRLTDQVIKSIEEINGFIIDPDSEDPSIKPPGVTDCDYRRTLRKLRLRDLCSLDMPSQNAQDDAYNFAWSMAVTAYHAAVESNHQPLPQPPTVKNLASMIAANGPYYELKANAWAASRAPVKDLTLKKMLAPHNAAQVDAKAEVEAEAAAAIAASKPEVEAAVARVRKHLEETGRQSLVIDGGINRDLLKDIELVPRRRIKS